MHLATDSVMTSLVDALRSWFEGHEEEAKGIGLALQFVEAGRGSDRSARVDVESTSAVGRVTVWDAGFCDVEVVGVAYSAKLQYHHHESVDRAALDELLAKWFSRFDRQSHVGSSEP